MLATLTATRNSAYKPRLAWLTALGGFWVFVLVLLGAFTTSIGAGMIFLDWPLSNGSINPEGWLTDVAMFAEHSHRLSAGLMSLITLAIWWGVWRHESRGWVRGVAAFAVGLVFFQALIGGLRVLLDHLHIEMVDTSVGRLFAMAHACLAQVFVCALLLVALALSRPWVLRSGGDLGPGVRRLGVACCALLLLQLGIAAVMRHSFAGMAIPTFPHSTADGDWLPAFWNFRIGIHFAHRVMALVLTAALLWFAVRLWRHVRATPGLRKTTAAMVALLLLQIYLGASVIWSGRNPYTTTAHVIVGAALLAVTFGLTCWAYRPTLPPPPTRTDEPKRLVLARA